jgi:hypothetical protein
MEQIVTLTLPKGASAQFVRDMQDALGAVKGVEDTGEIGTRGLGALTIGVWVKLAAEPNNLHDVLMEVVRKLCEVVRLQGIDGAKLTISNIIVELADMKPAALERTLATLKAPA